MLRLFLMFMLVYDIHHVNDVNWQHSPKCIYQKNILDNVYTFTACRLWCCIECKFIGNVPSAVFAPFWAALSFIGILLRASLVIYFLFVFIWGGGCFFFVPNYGRKQYCKMCCIHLFDLWIILDSLEKHKSVNGW